MLIYNSVISLFQKSRRKKLANGWELPDFRSTRKCTKVSVFLDKISQENNEQFWLSLSLRCVDPMEILLNCFEIGTLNSYHTNWKEAILDEI